MTRRADAGIEPADLAAGTEDIAGRLVGLLNELRDLNDRLLLEVAERKKAEEALKSREATIRALLNAPNDTALLIDTEGTILAANETALQRLGAHAASTLGLTADELVGHCVYDLFPPELARVRRERNERVVSTGKPARFEDERGGSWYDNSIYPVHGANGAIVGLAIFSRDITQVKRGELALKESQETVKALLNAPTDAALLIDADGTILALNETARMRLSTHAGMELDQDQFLGRCVYDLFPREVAEARRRRNEEVLRTGNPVRYEDERDGCWYDNSTYPVFGADGRVSALAVFTRDITAQKQAEEAIRHIAFHDALTGLYNRAAFNVRFQADLESALRSGRGLAVMCLDLDGFKRINDSLGHTAGDRVLQALAERLRRLVREGDTAARIGGDEFVVIFPGISRPEVAEEIAQRILRSVSEPFEVEGETLQASTSVGIALCPAHGSATEDLLKAADAAMYAAKQSGPNNYCMFRAGLPASPRSPSVSPGQPS